MTPEEQHGHDAQQDDGQSQQTGGGDAALGQPVQGSGASPDESQPQRPVNAKVKAQNALPADFSRSVNTIVEDRINAATDELKTQVRREVSERAVSESTSRRVDELLENLRIEAHNLGNDSGIQQDLAVLTTLLPDIGRSRSPHLIGVAEVAAAALTNKKEPPQDLIKGLVNGLRRRVRLYKWVGFSASIATAMGLWLFFFLFLVVAPFVLDQFLTNLGAGIDTYLGTPLPVLFLIGAAGALGSIVSVMTRIDGATFREGVAGPHAFVLIGLFKPIVGAAFALFVFALLQSPVVPLDLPQTAADGGEQNPSAFFFLALAFVAGFSERFATGLATRAEKSAGV